MEDVLNACMDRQKGQNYYIVTCHGNRCNFHYPLISLLSPRAYRALIYPCFERISLADEKSHDYKSGIPQHIGYAALDDEGTPTQIIELHIHGTKYGIRMEELRGALEGRHPAG